MSNEMNSMYLKDIDCHITWYEDDEDWEYMDGYWPDPFSDECDREHTYRSYVEGTYESGNGEHSGYARVSWNEDRSVQDIDFILWAVSPNGNWKRDLNEEYIYVPGEDNSDIWNWMDATYGVWYESLKKC